MLKAGTDMLPNVADRQSLESHDNMVGHDNHRRVSNVRFVLDAPQQQCRVHNVAGNILFLYEARV